MVLGELLIDFAAQSSDEADCHTMKANLGGAPGKEPEEMTEEELYHMEKFAVTEAGLSTEHFGGIPSIPDMETVLKL